VPRNFGLEQIILDKLII